MKRLATSLDPPGGITVIRRGCATDQPTLKARYLVAEAAALQARLAPQLDKGRRKTLARSIAKAQTKDDLGALARFVGVHEGQLRIVAGPSLIVPVRDLVGDAVHAEAERGCVRSYRSSLEPQRRVLLDQYRLVDMARKVVGGGQCGDSCVGDVAAGDELRIRCSFSRRSRARRCWRSSSGRASMRTAVSAWWSASG